MYSFVMASAHLWGAMAAVSPPCAPMTWRRYFVNGRLMGEIAQTAMLAAHFGAPVLMVSGDEAACFEARQFLGPIETAAVKRHLNRYHRVAR